MTTSASPQIEASWHELLGEEFDRTYFKELKTFLLREKEEHKVYPPGSLIFNALNQTPVPQVKVVILGQDPYHGPGQAHGLSFSVPPGIAPPPSLRNIFIELKNDLDIPPPPNGDLSLWAERGVLLLNTTLTVRQGSPASHRGQGWEKFTDQLIKRLAETRQHLVFILWGKHAQSKIPLIPVDKHLIIQSPHPSPFSAHRGFLGSNPFSKANKYLQEQGLDPVNWQL